MPAARRPMDACPAMMRALVLVLSLAPALGTTGGAQTSAPFAIDPNGIVLVEAGSPTQCHLRQPIWSPPDGPKVSLALQSYVVDGFSGIVIVDDVPAQIAGSKVMATRHLPVLDWTSLAVQNARLWPGGWFLGTYDGKLHQDFLYSANAQGNGRRAKYISPLHSIYIGENQLSADAGEDLLFPSQAPGSQLTACQIGVLGEQGDIAAFTPERPQPVNLTSTHDITETMPARCPNADIIAYVEFGPKDPGPALNVLGVTTAGDRLVAKRQFTDGGRESRSRLGIVDGFAWCPRVFGTTVQGYGLIAYYRRRETSSTNPTDVRRDLYVVPVSLRSKTLLIEQAVRVFEDVSVEFGQIDPTPPAWHPQGEYLFFLQFRPGTNPLHVAHIPRTSNLAAARNSIEVWPMEVWTGGSPPVNLAVSCSGDGRYLAIIAAGNAPQNAGILYNDAYILPLR